MSTANSWTVRKRQCQVWGSLGNSWYTIGYRTAKEIQRTRAGVDVGHIVQCIDGDSRLAEAGPGLDTAFEILVDVGRDVPQCAGLGELTVIVGSTDY